MCRLYACMLCGGRGWEGAYTEVRGEGVRKLFIQCFLIVTEG